MASFTGSSIKDVYKDILHTSNSNTGISTTIKQITCGDGDTTALYLSSRNLKVQPASDTTTNTVIYDASGNALVTVDSTNDLVKAGIGQHTVNTQFKSFGLFDFSPAAGVHHPLVTNAGGSEGTAYSGDVNAGDWGGTGTNPATSLTIASVAEQFVPSVWLLQQNITIDAIQYIMSCDASSTVNLHVCSYSMTTGSGSTAGDLSSGAVVGDHASAITVGDDRVSNGTITIQTADIDSGKAILVFAENVGGTDDISVQVNIKYHLR
tara:strand:+ start:509 stop:1303 length:795 start_codon:yes stop_codon:yes gene_type:complete